MDTACNTFGCQMVMQNKFSYIAWFCPNGLCCSLCTPICKIGVLCNSLCSVVGPFESFGWNPWSAETLVQICPWICSWVAIGNWLCPWTTVVHRWATQLWKLQTQLIKHAFLASHVLSHTCFETGNDSGLETQKLVTVTLCVCACAAMLLLTFEGGHSCSVPKILFVIWKQIY